VGSWEGIDLRHAWTRKPARKCIYPLIAVLLLDRMTDPTEEGGQSEPPRFRNRLGRWPMGTDHGGRGSGRRIYFWTVRVPRKR
jgi:hypothetical protein